MTRLSSTAVMARRAEPADSLDYFPTPPWATRGFCVHAMPQIWPWPDAFDCTAWDPACGEGHMAAALEDHFGTVNASDIFAYGFGGVGDFLHPDLPRKARADDWIITNPPFNQAASFIERALTLCRRGAAMLVRSQFTEGQGRYQEIFSRRPPQWIFEYAERVPMHRGRWVIDGTTASAYKWLVWLKTPSGEDRRAGTRSRWIPPVCRKTLQSPQDWLRFNGCCDLPDRHPLRALLKTTPPHTAMKRETTLADIHAGLEAARPASLGDVKREMERML